MRLRSNWFAYIAENGSWQNWVWANVPMHSQKCE